MRNLVVIGNCQAEMVSAGLRHPAFERRLTVAYHFAELPEAAHEAARRDLAVCDTVLMQDISNCEDYPLLAAIPERAEIVGFPCVRLASPWPFDSQNGVADARARDSDAQPPIFAHFDGMLGRLRTEIPDAEARYRAYRLLGIGGVVNFRRMHQFEERRLRALDDRFGCTVGRFILDNFRTRRLLCATGQPKPVLYRLLLQWLLPRLGIVGDYPDDGFLDAADADEVPVHPRVAHDLGICWADEETAYRFHGGEIRWEGYVRRYIEHFG